MFNVGDTCNIEHITIFNADDGNKKLAIFLKTEEGSFLLMATETKLDLEVAVNNEEYVVGFSRDKLLVGKNAIFTITATCLPDAGNLLFKLISLDPQPKQVKKSDIEKLFGCDIVNG